MPLLNNDALNDTILFEGLDDFSGGQNSAQSPRMIAPNQAATMSNMTVEIPGEIRKRRGFRDLVSDYVAGTGVPIQALFWYDTPSVNELCAVANGKFYRIVDGVWTEYFNSAIVSTTEQVCVEQLGDHIYWTDSGATGIRTWNGAAVSTVNPSPAARILTVHNGRVVAANTATVPDAIYWSGALDGTIWDLTNGTFRIGGGDGEEIIALQPWKENVIIVLRGGSTFAVYADPLVPIANYIVKPVHTSIGCAARKSTAQVGNDVWFLSPEGVLSVQRQLATDSSEIAQPVSGPIKDVIKRIRWEYAYKSCATFYNNHYLLAVPVDSNDPDTILDYNNTSGGWSVLPSQNGVVMTTHPYVGKKRLVIGTQAGRVRESLEYIRDDEEDSETYLDGQSTLRLNFTLPATFSPSYIESRLVSRSVMFGEPLNYKSGCFLEAEFKGKTGICHVRVMLDGGTPVEVGQVDLTAAPLILPFICGTRTIPASKWIRRKFSLRNLPQFRELQVDIISSEGGVIVRSINVSAFLNTLDFRVAL